MNDFGFSRFFCCSGGECHFFWGGEGEDIESSDEMPPWDNGIIKNAPNPSNISGQLSQMAAHCYSTLYWGS